MSVHLNAEVYADAYLVAVGLGAHADLKPTVDMQRTLEDLREVVSFKRLSCPLEARWGKNGAMSPHVKNPNSSCVFTMLRN